MLEKFYENGYLIIPGVVNSSEIEFLKSEISYHLSQSSSSVTRHLSAKVKAIQNLANSTQINAILSKCFQSEFQLVRTLYFNKTQKANWGVPWHQDKTITLPEKNDLPNFKAWSIKEGILHVQPPLEVMQNIITVRIHLDAAHEKNGALKVMPKSHRLGLLKSSQIEEIKNTWKAVTCKVNAGDVLIVSPLILHASNKAIEPSDRRVIHLEYSSNRLLQFGEKF
jgi:ectoine hydroxylase-related dioxygenase (phytanoyl-CoA dioxygenase family)